MILNFKPLYIIDLLNGLEIELFAMRKKEEKIKFMMKFNQAGENRF